MATGNGTVDKKQKQGSGDASTGTDLTCESENYGASFVDKLSKARESDYMCNYTIRVEGKEIRAHALVLATNSDLFKTMFTSGFPDSSKDEVELKDRTYIGVKAVVDHMYSGKLEMNTQTLPEILDAASYLQVQSALDLCEQAIKDKMITVESWQDAMTLADMYNLKGAESDAMKCLAHSFSEAKPHMDLKILNYSIIQKILKYLETTATERQLFVLLEEWMMHDYDARKEHLLQFLDLISFHFMDKKELVDSMESAIIRKHENSSDVVKSTFENVAEADKKTREILLNPKYNRPRGFPTLMMLVTSLEQKGETRCLLQNDPCIRSSPIETMKVWQELDLSYAGSCCYRNFVYVCGGGTSTGIQTELSAKCRVYNPSYKCWVDIAPLNIARQQCSVVGVAGQIFVIGGFIKKHEDLVVATEIERYNQSKNAWEIIVKVNTDQLNAGIIKACTFKGKIYMVLEGNGQDGFKLLLRCYSPKERGFNLQWEEELHNYYLHCYHVVPMDNTIVIDNCGSYNLYETISRTAREVYSNSIDSFGLKLVCYENMLIYAGVVGGGFDDYVLEMVRVTKNGHQFHQIHDTFRKTLDFEGYLFVMACVRFVK